VLLALWSPKGGSGTSVVAAALAIVLARRGPARLADLAGDLPAILGLPPEPPDSKGLAGWLASGPEAPTEALDGIALEVVPGLRLLPLGMRGVAADLPAESGAALAAALGEGDTVVDAGLAAAGTPSRAVVEVADVPLVVVRGCYLALRRAVCSPLVAGCRGAVLVEEPGRALGAGDVAEVLGLPVLARFPVRPSVARAVDAGVLAHRLPGHLAGPAATVVDGLEQARAA
jgi:hypothetical protein